MCGLRLRIQPIYYTLPLSISLSVICGSLGKMKLQGSLLKGEQSINLSTGTCVTALHLILFSGFLLPFFWQLFSYLCLLS